MTEDEILQEFPEATTSSKIEKYIDGYASVVIYNLDIEGHKYVVNFVMDNNSNKLKRVLIKPSAQSDNTEIRFRALEKLLVQKYGSESYKNEDRKPDTRINRSITIGGTIDLQTVWNFPTKILNLVMVS
jgi:hypothetical protein